MAWSSVGGKTTHYNAVLEVTAEGSGSRVTWTIDLLPDELAAVIEGMQKQGLRVMKQTFERG